MAKKHTEPPAVTDDSTKLTESSADAAAPETTQDQIGADETQHTEPPAVTDDVPPPTPKAEDPAKLVLTAPYGFIDDDGQHRYWHAGTEVTDADEIAVLIKRKAPVQGI